MKAEEQARADIVEVGRRLWERGYVASNDGNISVRLDEHRLITTPKSVSKGFMTPDMMVITDLDGKKISGERDPSSELKMHLEVYRNRPDARAVVHAHPPTATGFAVAGIPLDRTCACGSDHHARQHSDRRVRDAVHRGTAGGGAQVRQGARRPVARQSRRAGDRAGRDVGVYRMETIEHFARISLVARTLGREHLLSRDEVERLQGLRGMYGIASPAPICADDVIQASGGQLECQVVQAPQSEERLVPNNLQLPPGGIDGEIRLTYRELTALIEDALRALK